MQQELAVMGHAGAQATEPNVVSMDPVRHDIRCAMHAPARQPLDLLTINSNLTTQVMHYQRWLPSKAPGFVRAADLEIIPTPVNGSL